MDLALIAVAALAGGAVNAIAGGGSLITFPTLVALGVPDIVANMTNTVAMCPGYFGATLAQRRDLVGQGARAGWVLPIGAAGGIAGALLLRATGQAAFDVIVPFLLVFAAALIAIQDRLRAIINPPDKHARAIGWAAVPVGLASVYGGYFGAGMGVLVLAGLGLVLDDTLIRINALKQSVSLAVNVAAASVFVATSSIDWQIAIAMAAGSLVGGALGGAIASRVSAKLLRAVVIVVALGVAAVYFVRL